MISIIVAVRPIETAFVRGTSILNVDVSMLFWFDGFNNALSHNMIPEIGI